MMTTVTYNNEVIASIPDGNRAILPIANKQMSSNIIISIPASQNVKVSINYNEAIVGSYDSGNRIILPVKDKQMSTNLIIIVEASLTSNFLLSDGSVLLTSDGEIFNAKEE